MSFSGFFIPTSNTIATITNANPGVVTTNTNHGYSTGLIVRLVVPTIFGMPQVNGKVFNITVLTSNSFSIGVDTTNYYSFALNSTKQQPQVIPVGNIANIVLEPTENNGTLAPQL